MTGLVDDTQGQGFAVEYSQDWNFRSGIQIFGQCTDQKWTSFVFITQTKSQQKLASILEWKLLQKLE